MNANAIQAGLFVIIVALLVKPVGVYLERLFERRRTLLDPLLLPLERLIHRPMGIDHLRNNTILMMKKAFFDVGHSLKDQNQPEKPSSH